MEPTTPKHSYLETLLLGPMTKKRIILLSVVFLISVSIAGYSFWIGLKHDDSTQWILPPTPTPLPIEEISVTPLATESPDPTNSPTPIRTPSPTKKPTSTPTLTPTSTQTPTPTPTPQTITITSTANLDGFRSSNSGGNSTADIQAGRNDALIERGFVSFSLSSLPSGASIEQARLRMYQKNVIGHPFESGSNLLVDHLNFGDSFDNSAYALDSLSNGNNVGSLSNSNNIEWKELNVTTSVQDDKQNNRSHSQFRLRTTNETIGGDPAGDFYIYEAADAGNGEIPQLIIRYH